MCFLFVCFFRLSSSTACMQSTGEGQQNSLCKMQIGNLLCPGVSLLEQHPKNQWLWGWRAGVPPRSWCGCVVVGWETRCLLGSCKSGLLSGRFTGQAPGAVQKVALVVPWNWRILSVLTSITCKFHSKVECHNFFWNYILCQLHLSEIKELGSHEHRILWAVYALS